ncbi:MAG: heme-dependent peroxidase, partial [Acidobacteriaceae bacterium]|nr:heme-dependent peroxidase [Acidobacteriaceae bacterium]
FRLRRQAWRGQAEAERGRMLRQAEELLAPLEASPSETRQNQSALYSMIGHKGDLMLLHFRNSLEQLCRAEVALAALEFSEFLEPATSYVSVVELGLYESTVKTYGQLAERGVEPHSEEWNASVKDVLARQAAAMESRLYPQIPRAKYVCFYPMDRKRGEQKNWYEVPLVERQRLMHEHGLVGRRYSDCVKQIISSSIGFDDWEWGVDLFADDPLVFKKLIYEMRFDEVSAVYALFGSFFLGMRIGVRDLPELLHV